jgi:ABC-type transport system substrate-binding protein
MTWTTPNVARPDNRWRGSNRSGYVNPRVEELWGHVLGTIDPEDRQKWLIAAITVMMEDAVAVLTHITPNVMAYNAAIAGPTEPAVVDTARIWNVWQWSRR